MSRLSRLSRLVEAGVEACVEFVVRCRSVDTLVESKCTSKWSQPNGPSTPGPACIGLMFRLVILSGILAGSHGIQPPNAPTPLHFGLMESF